MIAGSFVLALLAAIGVVFGADSGCPTFHGVVGNEMFNYPTPNVEFSYSNATGVVDIAVTTVYDPNAALVIGFAPMTANRTSIDQCGVCENRDAANIPSSSWNWGNYASKYPTACYLDDSANPLYPKTSNNGLWKRSVEDGCSLVTYTLSHDIRSLHTACGASMWHITTVNNRTEFTATLYVTYVRPSSSNSTSLQKREQQIGLTIIDEVIAEEWIVEETNVEKPTCNVDCPVLNWNDLGAFITITGKTPGSQKGLPCNYNLEASLANNSSLTCSKQECQCDLHCTTFYCPSGQNMCSQNFTAQITPMVYPGQLQTQYVAKWNMQSCNGWAANSTTECQQPNADHYLVAKWHYREQVRTFIDYESPFVPFVRLMVAKPNTGSFPSSFTNRTILLTVRTEDLTDQGRGVSEIHLCELSPDRNHACYRYYSCSDLKLNNATYRNDILIWNSSTGGSIVNNGDSTSVTYNITTNSGSNWYVEVIPTGSDYLPGVQAFCIGTSSTCLSSQPGWYIPLDDEDDCDYTPPNPVQPDNDEPWTEQIPSNDDGFDVAGVAGGIAMALTAIGAAAML